MVVFALRPEFGFIRKAFVAQEPGEHPGVEEALLPVWYHMVQPPKLYHRIARMQNEELTLRPLANGLSFEQGVSFFVRIKAEADHLQALSVGRGWAIGVTGKVLSLPGGNLWDTYGSTDEHPDRPLPRYDAFYLGPLPPIVKPATAASQPSSE
ncbi:hypothetical protein [uncultured Ilyobacter sp.]|uniref:hypothetical protein n=1 Tax=uncultured Ilyobacter sp. TaxID=544433 RepID=UPI0029F4837B|nr:hypothetical protein [uncultured Ilyobacter sp.]